jgi:environmental stress-induced protein Ves
MKLITYDELIATPWKNGGGVTRELACFPVDASMSDFIWRVSIADVSQSGPFSSFPGIDRVITLLDGDGMQLQFADDTRHALVDKLIPYSFRGEAQVNAHLIGSPSRDFNLMLRRDAARGTVEVRHASGTIEANQTTLLLFCAAGRWRVSGTNKQYEDLQSRDAILLEQALSDTMITSLDAQSALLCVRITLA